MQPEKKVYEIDSKELNIFLENAKEMAKRDIADKFYGIIISTEWVCKMHEVSAATVARYVRQGYLPVLEKTSSNSNNKFRLSDILLTDFDKLKKLI
ncbi:MAG: hypothetical protein LBQ74_09765 [Prevotella sp.]|jgi:hypothetical protein|nr:hypothetical protein [Prevotella sp.]